MGIKIHEYANEAFQINDEDFYDVDYWNGASYESRKISGATLKAELSGGAGVQSVTGGTANTIVEVNNADPSNPIIQINGVKYANVLFVDNTNPSPTPNVNRFDQPFSDTGSAMVTAVTLTPTLTNRTLIYVRRGQYTGNIILQNFTDWYCEPGVVFVNTAVDDNIQNVDSKFLGKASFTGFGFNNGIFRVRAALSNVVFEFDEINATRLAFETGGGGTAFISGRKVYSESIAVAAGSTFRGSRNVTLNITEEFKSVHQTILFKNLTGKVVVNCPKLAMGSGNYFGGNFKQVIQCADGNSGGTCTINGNLVNEDTGGFLGGISGIIGRWTGSDNMTLVLNGNIIGSDNLAIRAEGGANSRTIINGDASSNIQVAFITSSSNVVFRNGTLINYNSFAGANGYPILITTSSAKTWIENCHLYSFGSADANIGAVWMQSTTNQLSINNSVHSGTDAIGFFIRNAIGGQPLTNVRIHNCRSTKPLDVNIVDLLSPTGFIQDTNILAINFI
jgi:hypothetical protein